MVSGAAHPTRRRVLLAGTAGLVAGAATASMAGAAHAATPTAARAAAVEPDIDSCATWGARPARGSITVLTNRPTRIIVHHTVSDNTNDFSRAQAHEHAHWVQDLHMDDNGWVDTGYHFLVSRGGWITEGRHESLRTLTAGSGLVLGAHTSGQNYNAIGIANEGAYHDGATPPAAQWEVLVTLCAYVCQQYGIAPTQLYGHMDFNSTQCPGIFHDMLPQLRSEVADALS
ncbi:peptidoglycan recognition protein family protein [Streptomyces millisiae]|uniref:Peptidoglycan recognition family protein n=1 Tax=Streptomyces millisiae TaxID=3075542 RepID=A0ABU2LJC7_9ACTN|nr:peptidoglycan recognition family protein [Streptomyces sp. DSM 44918]MDT0317674.1 peptidoglycan recognition family protein [Streptomyces sp. DSM 44918]